MRSGRLSASFGSQYWIATIHWMITRQEIVAHSTSFPGTIQNCTNLWNLCTFVKIYYINIHLLIIPHYLWNNITPIRLILEPIETVHWELYKRSQVYDGMWMDYTSQIYDVFLNNWNIETLFSFYLKFFLFEHIWIIIYLVMESTMLSLL